MPMRVKNKTSILTALTPARSPALLGAAGQVRVGLLTTFAAVTLAVTMPTSA